MYGTFEFLGDFVYFAKCPEIYVGLKDAASLGTSFPAGFELYVNYSRNDNLKSKLAYEKITSGALYDAGYRYRIILDNKLAPGSRISVKYIAKDK
ncbi:MAG: hypothetical protein MJ195_01630 [Mycoplasmoidaceae bacterium]|nr:hypothetical protein [Mycoplasmoidaceae bacterium]